MRRHRWEDVACRSGHRKLLTCQIVVVLLLIPPHVYSFLLPLHHHRPTTAVSVSGDSSSPLIPEPNPFAATDGVSTSGVSYRKVLEDYLVPLYPPTDLPARVAISRSEGYWPYIQNSANNNGVPPQELTYGEFDFYFFAQLLDRALEFSNATTTWQDCVFTDLGSGTGRLVLAAAALHPQWKLCRGIELLQGLHAFAEERQPLSAAAAAAAPVAFQCGSILDPYMYFGDSDLVFCFSTCMDQSLLDQTAQAIGRQCRPGTVVITTDYRLPTTGTIHPVDKDDRVPYGDFRIRSVDEVEGWCWLTGGASTAYVHVVEASLWTEDSEPLDPPVLSLEDIALEVVELYEAGELADTAAFKRKVYNDMVFHGIPERFYPKL